MFKHPIKEKRCPRGKSNGSSIAIQMTSCVIDSLSIMNSAVCEALQVTTIPEIAPLILSAKDFRLFSFVKTKGYIEIKHQLPITDFVLELTFSSDRRNICHFNLSKRRNKVLIAFTIAGTAHFKLLVVIAQQWQFETFLTISFGAKQRYNVLIVTSIFRFDSIT